MVRRKAFIFFTLALPLLALLAMGVYQVITGIDQPPPAEEEVAIGYVDEIGMFSQYTRQAEVTLVPFATQNEAIAALLEGDIKEYFIISSDYVATGVVYRFTLERELEAPNETQWVMKNFLVSNLLHGKTGPEVAQRVRTPMALVSTRLTETGEVATEQGGYESFIIPYLFSILLVASIFFSSSYLLQGLGEEKENRIMEILLSSVSARQLLAGKVIGLGAAGLIQILVFCLLRSWYGWLQRPSEGLLVPWRYRLTSWFWVPSISFSVICCSPYLWRAWVLSALRRERGSNW